jgi:hypothetical protein
MKRGKGKKKRGKGERGKGEKGKGKNSEFSDSGSKREKIAKGRGILLR